MSHIKEFSLVYTKVNTVLTVFYTDIIADFFICFIANKYILVKWLKRISLLIKFIIIFLIILEY